MASYCQAGEMLGSWTIAKREKCWVLELSPSGTDTGFSDCRQAGQILGSRTATKREKCRVPGLPPSGHISTVEKIAERIKRNPSPACGRGAGVRAFIRRMNLTQAGQTGVFALLRRYATPPPAGGRRDWLCEFYFGLQPSGKNAGFPDCRQAGKMLGSRTVAKREKCWVLGLPPSGRNTGFPDCRQAGQILGSRTAAKREKCWGLRLPPSGRNTGFPDCRQAGQILGSRTAAKREKCWGLRLPQAREALFVYRPPSGVVPLFSVFVLPFLTGGKS